MGWGDAKTAPPAEREATNGRPNRGWDDAWEDPVGPAAWPAHSVELEHTASGKIVAKVKVRADDPDEAAAQAVGLFDRLRQRYHEIAPPAVSWDGELATVTGGGGERAPEDDF